MNLLGIQLTMLIGQTAPMPAPGYLLESLQSIQVELNDSGMSGFQITFQVGRGGAPNLRDFKLLDMPLLKPSNRVVLIATLNAIPRVIMDGFIKHQQLAPGSEPGKTTLTVTGEDVSAVMNKKKYVTDHKAQSEYVIANKLIGNYSQYGIVPVVKEPPVSETPNPNDKIPSQKDTDLKYLQQLADRWGYVFYITPGAAPMSNFAYWGPSVREGVPQRALSVDMGPYTNVESINFQYDTNKPTWVAAMMQEPDGNKKVVIKTDTSTRAPLSMRPEWLANRENVSTTDMEYTKGMSEARAQAIAQAITDKSIDEVVTATGELDVLQYGDLLQPRGLVGLRGAGYSYDGDYYVKKVIHKISKESYKQSFTLTRDGLGALTATVRP